MLRWQVIAVMGAAGIITAVFSTAVNPVNLIASILYSPPGLVLVGRISAVYHLIYHLTGNTYLSLAAGILASNAMTVATCLAAPAAMYAAHQVGLRMKRPGWLVKAGWELPQTVTLFVSLYLAAFTGLSMAAVAAGKGVVAFMVPEALYVAITSSTVYHASKLPYEGFTAAYKSQLRKTLPPILALMVVSAFVEAYEALR